MRTIESIQGIPQEEVAYYYQRFDKALREGDTRLRRIVNFNGAALGVVPVEELTCLEFPSETESEQNGAGEESDLRALVEAEILACLAEVREKKSLPAQSRSMLLQSRTATFEVDEKQWALSCHRSRRTVKSGSIAQAGFLDSLIEKLERLGAPDTDLLFDSQPEDDPEALLLEHLEYLRRLPDQFWSRHRSSTDEKAALDKDYWVVEPGRIVAPVVKGELRLRTGDWHDALAGKLYEDEKTQPQASRDGKLYRLAYPLWIGMELTGDALPLVFQSEPGTSLYLVRSPWQWSARAGRLVEDNQLYVVTPGRWSRIAEMCKARLKKLTG